MKKFTCLSLSFIFAGILAAPALSVESKVHWSYAGKADPTHWADGEPENAACKSGRKQSPIALTDATATRVANKDFDVHYEAGTISLVNNGHTVMANVSDDADTVTLKGESYKLDQFHFHTPSEHTLNGKRYPMELHLVNKSSSGKYTVIGVFIKQGKLNKALESSFKDLPASPTPVEEKGLPEQVDLAALIPAHKDALVYSGSLTTPPCSENVNWVVFEQPIEMSSQQINAFKAIFHDNHRPLQDSSGRAVEKE